MQIFKFCTFFLFLAITTAYPAVDDVIHFHGYKVLKAVASTEKQVLKLRELADTGKYDFWSEPRIGKGADIMASKETLPKLVQFLKETDIPYTTMIEDVESLVQLEGTRSRQSNGSMNWDDYQTLDTIYGWLDDLTITNPSLISREVIGRSTEGRDMRVYKISTDTNNNGSRPAFWIDATIHAREWASTSTITFIVNELVTRSSNYSDILGSVDFYICPVVNPDGYVFTHVANRLWRKTRTNHANSTNPACWGVDANRNFAVGFGAEGSSGDACSETYRGPQAYSEPETRAVRDYIRGKGCNVNWTAFVTIHTYSQLWMTPYGYSLGLPDNYDELMELGSRAVSALTAVSGTEYELGSSANILYLSAGSSRDWAHLEGGFRYVYTLELRDTGRYGFILPPAQIIPTALETWAGLQVVARHIAN